MSAPEDVATKEMDYLDEDRPIRGQNYVCLSFLSPEDVLADKNVFYFERYIEAFSKDMAALFDNLRAKYADQADMLDSIRATYGHLFSGSEMQDHFRYFARIQGLALDAAFREKHPFRTTMRGIKVRGSYDTLEEAKIRAQVLKKMGDKFDIYVAQVGCWCPWSPNPEDLGDVQYAEGQLNTLMEEYHKNATLKDAFFEQRKQEAIDAATKRALEKTPVAPVEEVTHTAEALLQEDPWLQQKQKEGADAGPSPQ